MKQFAILGLAVIGGLAVFRYVRRTPFGQAFTPQQTGRQPNSSVSARIAEVIPGIPVFSGNPATNRPDQIAASMATNNLSTIDGSDGYEPAFGPTTNRGGGYTEVF